MSLRKRSSEPESRREPSELQQTVLTHPSCTDSWEPSFNLLTNPPQLFIEERKAARLERPYGLFDNSLRSPDDPGVSVDIARLH